MDIQEHDLLDQDPLQDYMLAESALLASFESLDRASGSLSALNDLLNNADQFTQSSFESAARPLLSAIMSGTDVDIESTDLSVESVRGIVGTAVQTILKALQNFFKSLIEFLSNVDLAASWLMRKVVLLERQVASSRGKTAGEDKVTLGRQYRFLRVGRVFAEDSLRLETELKAMKNLIDVIGTQYTNEILKAADKLPGVARGKSGADLTSAMVGLVKSIPFDSLSGSCNMGPAPTDRFTRANAKATPPLLGGKSIFYLKSDLDTKGVRGFRFHGFFYETTGREQAQVESTHDFNTLSPAQIGNIPVIVKDILILISKASNASTRSKVNRAKATLDNFVKSQNGLSTDIETIRKTVVTLTYWMSNPSRGLYLDAMSVCRAVVVYCNASIRTYR